MSSTFFQFIELAIGIACLALAGATLMLLDKWIDPKFPDLAIPGLIALLIGAVGFAFAGFYFWLANVFIWG